MDELKSLVTLLKASRSVEKQIEKNIAESGLSLSEFMLMEVLYSKDEALPIQDIAKKVLLSSGSMTYVIAQLVHKGHIQRINCTEDKQVIYADLTEIGKAKFATTFIAHQTFVEGLFGVLTDEERLEYTRLKKKSECTPRKHLNRKKVRNMIRKIDHTKMGCSNLGWLRSLFHFSFADYYNPANMNFGVLRVINDDLVEAGTGFVTHPHRDMEIVSYVIDGELTHGDNMGNANTIIRGHVQYMSAGTGVQHSEHNRGKVLARFLQIWIMPDQRGYKPQYGDMRFTPEQRHNQWLKIVSGMNGDAPIKIHQDINMSVLELDTGKEISFEVKAGRQAYLVQIEGSSDINGASLSMRDALESVEENLTIKANENSHYLAIEMRKA